MSLQCAIVALSRSSMAHIGVWLVRHMCEFKNERTMFIHANNIV